MLSRMQTRMCLATVAAGLAVALGCGAYTAIAAPAPGTASSRAALATPAAQKVTVSGYGVRVGPFNAKGGYKVEVEALGCGTKYGVVEAEYLRGDAKIFLAHGYSGSYATCTVAKDLKSATLKVKWGKVLDVDATVATSAKLKKQQECKGTALEYRTAKLTGTATIAIHPRDFGTQTFARDAAKLFAIASSNDDCEGSSSSSSGTSTLPLSGTSGSGFSAVSTRRALGLTALSLATTPTTTTTTTSPTTTTPTTTTSTTPSTIPPTVTADGSGTQFFAIFTPNLGIESFTEASHNPVTLIIDQATDDPAAKVYGQMYVAVNTPDAFKPAAGDSTASVTANAAFVSGTLQFTGTKACNATTAALDGTLTGQIVVHDPIFGKLTFNGPSATGALVGNLDADTGSC